MNKSFSERYEPYMLLMVLLILMSAIFAEAALGIFLMPVMPAMLIYFKRQLNIVVSIVIFALMTLLMAFSGSPADAALTVTPILLITMLLYYGTERYRLDYRVIFWISSFIIFLFFTLGLYYIMKHYGITMASFAENIKSWYLSNIEMQEKALNLTQSQKNSLISQIKIIDKNNAAILLVFANTTLSFLVAALSLYFYKKMKQDNKGIIQETSDVKMTIIEAVILVVIMMVGRLVEPISYVFGQSLYVAAETMLSSISLIVLYALISHKLKKGIFKKSYFIPSLIVLFLIYPISEIVMLSDAVLDFRNVTGKSLFHHIKSLILGKEK